MQPIVMNHPPYTNDIYLLLFYYTYEFHFIFYISIVIIIMSCLGSGGRAINPDNAALCQPIFNQIADDRSNINRLPRDDRLVTTLLVDSKQDVTPGNLASVIVDGGMVVKKGLLLGRIFNRVPGVISFMDGHFLGLIDNCTVVEFDSKPEVVNLNLKMIALGATGEPTGFSGEFPATMRKTSERFV